MWASWKVPDRRVCGSRASRLHAEQAAVAGTVRRWPLLRVVRFGGGGGALLRGDGGGHGPPEAGRRFPRQRRGREVPREPGARGGRRPLASGLLAREPHRRCAVVPESLKPRG